MSDKKKFIKGVTSGYAFMIVSMVVSLWMVPFVFKYLTKPEYGIFAIIADLLAWLGISNLGITSAFSSRSAQLIAKNDRDEINILTNTAFFIQLFTSIIIIIFGLIFILSPDIIFGDEIINERIDLVILMVFGGFLIQYISQPLNSILISDKQAHIDNYLRFGLLALQTIITVLLLEAGMKLLSLALSSLFSNLIISFITLIRVKKSFSYIKFSFKNWDRNHVRYLLKNGIWFSIGGIAGILIFRMDTFFIGKYISLTLVATFVINNRLYQIAEKFHSQLFNTSRPYFSQIFGEGDLSKLSKMYNIVYYTSFLVAFLGGLIIYLTSRWFITWWVGADFYLGETTNLFLFINFVLQSAVLPNRILLASTLHKLKFHSLTRILEGLAKFLLSLFLIQSFGVSALLFSSILACLIFSSLLLNYVTAEFLSEKFTSKLFPFLPVILLIPIFFKYNNGIVFLNLLIATLFMFFIIYRSLKKSGVNLNYLYVWNNRKF